MKPKSKPNPHNFEGRRLLAALMSCHMRVGMDYALKNYTPEEVDPSWGELADTLLRAMNRAVCHQLFAAGHELGEGDPAPSEQAAVEPPKAAVSKGKLRRVK